MYSRMEKREKFTGPKRKKQTELARIVKDDSDGKKTRETYVSPEKGHRSPIIFKGLGEYT